jgi:hypothetical protein
MNLLRSRKTFIGLALLAFPPASWAFAIYLHDDLKVTLGHEVLYVLAYFGGAVLLTVAFGAILRRTQNEIVAVALGSVFACLVWAVGFVIYAFSQFEGDPFQ